MRFASPFRALAARGDLLVRGLLAAVHSLALLWFAPVTGLPLDDAWIHQVVGRTFAQSGTLGYAPGQHGAAATSYLWAALLGVNFKWLHLDPVRWAFALNALATIVTGQLLFALLRRARPEGVGEGSWILTSFAAALLACAGPNVLWYAHSGMEASPLLALSTLAVWAATDTTKKPTQRAIIAGIASGLLALLRPEALPLGGLLVAYVYLRGREAKRAAFLGAPWALAIVAYAGSNLAKTGHLSPSTLAGRRWLWFGPPGTLDRSDLAFEHVQVWIKRLGTYTFDASDAVTWLLGAVAALGALTLLRLKNDGLRLLFGWAAAHGLFYLCLLPTPGHGGRYQPFTPLLFTACVVIGGAIVLRALGQLVSARVGPSLTPWAVAMTAATIALMLPAMNRFRHAHVLAVAHIDETELAMGRWLDRLPKDAVVASFDIGGIGFAAHRPILDAGGLSDPAAATLLASGRLSQYLEQKNVRYIVLPEGSERVLPVFDAFTARLHLRDNPRVRLEPMHVFETPIDKWRPGIEATWNSAVRQIVYRVAFSSKDEPRPSVNATDSRVTLSGPVPPRDRKIAEHDLAVLAANGLAARVQVTTASPEAASSNTCDVSLGRWGVAITGCENVAETSLLRPMLFETLGRYLDVDDLGGAARAVPHVLARAHARTDARFAPVLAPLAYPLPGGTPDEPFGPRSWGLALFFGALAFASALTSLGPHLRELVRRGRSRWWRLPVTALLVLGACTQGGRPDLFGAVARGQESVRSALAAGADVAARDGAGRTPIFAAAESGDAAILALLVAHGADVDHRMFDGSTALHAAARRGCGACLAILAPRSKTLDATAGPRKRTALHEAAIAGSRESVSALLRAGAKPNERDTFGQAPLHALPWLDPAPAGEIAAVLYAGGADFEAADARAFTVAHVAAMAGSDRLLRTLLASARDLDRATTPEGATAYDVARRYGQDACAELLFERGAPMREGAAWPPLHDAARMDAADRIAKLIAWGADTSRPFQGHTPFEIASANDSVDALALLSQSKRP